jgi:hypothetical protein
MLRAAAQTAGTQATRFGSSAGTTTDTAATHSPSAPNTGAATE